MYINYNVRIFIDILIINNYLIQFYHVIQLKFMLKFLYTTAAFINFFHNFF